MLSSVSPVLTSARLDRLLVSCCNPKTQALLAKPYPGAQPGRKDQSGRLRSVLVLMFEPKGKGQKYLHC